VSGLSVFPICVQLISAIELLGWDNSTPVYDELQCALSFIDYLSELTVLLVLFLIIHL